ncbi:MAG: Ig-like domain-containing protein [Longimicrobiales bacterium]
MTRTTGMRAVAFAALTFAMAGCGRGILHDDDVRPASIALELVAARATGGPTRAFDRTDRVWLRIGDGAGTRIERDIAITGSGTDVHVPIEVPLRRLTEAVELVVELRLGEVPLFRGEASVSLRAGRVTHVPMTLDPVVYTLLLADTLPPLASYGDSVRFSGATIFATGDTIEAVPLDWTSLDPDVIAIEDGIPVAQADGVARLVGRAGEREDTVRVRVYAIVHSIIVDPRDTDLDLGESRQYSALLFDARGNPIRGRSVSWTSSDPTVISIDAGGLATGVGIGTARISAASGPAMSDVELTARPGAPTVTAPSVEQVTGSDAMVGATVTPGGSPATVVFEWSTTPDFADRFTTAPQSAGAGTTPVPVTAQLAGLTPGVTYWVRAVVTSAAGTVTGAPISFTTVQTTPPPVPGAAPVVVTGAATNVSATSADLNGMVDANGAPARTWFEWGTDPALAGAAATAPQSASPASGAVPFAAAAGPLLPATTYYFRAVADNTHGTAAGAIASFTTAVVSPPVPPAATTVAATGIGRTKGTFNGTVNPNGSATTAWFEWGTDPTLATFNTTAVQSVGAGLADVPVAASLTGLVWETRYYFRAVAAGPGGTVFGAILSFRALGPPGSD